MSLAQLLLWLSVVAITTLATIDGHYRDRARQLYVCKPLITLLILLGAVLAAGDPSYRWPIVAGLVFSLAGDGDERRSLSGG